MTKGRDSSSQRKPNDMEDGRFHSASIYSILIEAAEHSERSRLASLCEILVQATDADTILQHVHSRLLHPIQALVLIGIRPRAAGEDLPSSAHRQGR